jgi:hypothetical protein
MKKSETLLLKIVLISIAIIVSAALVWFPQMEGRAENLDFLHTYLDQFIIVSYLASIPFFAGLYQAFRLLNLIDADKAFTQDAVNGLRMIKFLSLSIVGLIMIGLVYIRFFMDGADSAGVLALGFFMSLAFGIVTTAAGVFQKLFQNAVDLKAENDLTV